MSRIVVTNNLTLDGVMQAPGRPDEDRRDGFAHGGWAQPYADAILGQKMGEGIASTGALLLGRRTYEDFASIWPRMPDDNPFAAVLNNTPKYVASRTLESPEWNNSSVIEGDVAEAVKRLKREDGKDILVNGSGALVRTLIRDHLLDELRLLVHPVVVGSGTRLFNGESDPAELALADSHAYANGVIGLTYRPLVAEGDQT